MPATEQFSLESVPLPGNTDPRELPDHQAFANELAVYKKDLFFERFEGMLDATVEYQGQLPIAWDKSQATPVDEKSAVTEHIKLDKYNEDQVRTLINRMHNSKITSASIEAAHVYAYEDLGDPELRGSVFAQSYFAAALSQRLDVAGIPSRKILFVDNYNPDPKDGELNSRLDIEELVELTESAGFRPERVMYEGDMELLASAMIKIMHDRQGIVKQAGVNIEIGENNELILEGPTALQLKRHGIDLYKVNEGLISCAMLDAALSVVKMRHLGQAVVNVLPRKSGDSGFSYKGQQKKMRTIFTEHLDVREGPFFNLYTGHGPQSRYIAAGANNVFRKRH